MFPFILLGVALVYLATRDSLPMVDKTKTGGAVLHIERMRGVLPQLQAKVLAWNGPFDILVAPEGGLRTDAAKQIAYYNAGNSKAKTLKETAHGRGAAVDMWPVDFNPAVSLDLQPVAKVRFIYMREWAESQGLVLIGTPYESWDMPHWQLPNWTNYPYPPNTSNNSVVS